MIDGLVSSLPQGAQQYPLAEKKRSGLEALHPGASLEFSEQRPSIVMAEASRLDRVRWVPWNRR